MVKVPLPAPLATGEKVTPTVQLAPAAILGLQVSLDTAKPALTAILEKFNDTPSRLVTVTVFGALVLPTATVPKFKVLGETVTGAVPVPIRLMAWGLVTALSVKLSVPEAGPMAVGEKVTPTLQLAWEAILAPQVLLATAKPALGVMLPKLSDAGN